MGAEASTGAETTTGVGAGAAAAAAGADFFAGILGKILENSYTLSLCPK
jgi:hypothetical protein